MARQQLPQTPRLTEEENLSMMAQSLATCIRSGMTGAKVATFLPAIEGGRDLIETMQNETADQTISTFQKFPQVWEHLKLIPEETLHHFLTELIEGAKKLAGELKK